MLPTTVPRTESASASRLSKPGTVSESFGGNNQASMTAAMPAAAMPSLTPEFRDQQKREQSAFFQLECVTNPTNSQQPWGSQKTFRFGTWPDGAFSGPFAPATIISTKRVTTTSIRLPVIIPPRKPLMSTPSVWCQNSPAAVLRQRARPGKLFDSPLIQLQAVCVQR